MSNKSLLATLAVLGLWVTFVSIVSAQTSNGERETLRGLKGVQVVVGTVNPEAEGDGLVRSQLQRDVELRLRKAGIRVLTKEEAANTPGSPFLYVRVNTLKHTLWLYAFCIEVSLHQRAALARDPNIQAFAVTWNTSTVGDVSANDLQKIRELVGEIVDMFMNDYLAVNPKGL